LSKHPFRAAIEAGASDEDFAGPNHYSLEVCDSKQTNPLLERMEGFTLEAATILVEGDDADPRNPCLDAAMAGRIDLSQCDVRGVVLDN